MPWWSFWKPCRLRWIRMWFPKKIIPWRVLLFRTKFQRVAINKHNCLIQSRYPHLSYNSLILLRLMLQLAIIRAISQTTMPAHKRPQVLPAFALNLKTEKLNNSLKPLLIIRNNVLLFILPQQVRWEIGPHLKWDSLFPIRFSLPPLMLSMQIYRMSKTITQ